MSKNNVVAFVTRKKEVATLGASEKIGIGVQTLVAGIHRDDRDFFWDRIGSHAQETAQKFLKILLEQGEVDFFSEGESYTPDSILRVKDNKTGEIFDVSVEELILLMEVDPNRKIENYETYIWYSLKGLGIVVRPHMTEGTVETMLRAYELDTYHPEKIINSDDDIYTVFLRGNNDTLLADGDLGVFTTKKSITLLDLMIFSARNCDLSQVTHCEVCYSDGNVEKMRTIIEGDIFRKLLEQSLMRVNSLYANMDIKDGIKS